MAEPSPPPPKGPGALSHIRVLDLSRVLAGPWCTQNLADLGAEVIKVERPGRGDDTRAWGPPWITDGQGARTSDSTYFASANRGKRSITLDIASPCGQALARELAAHSDVFIENYKVGDLKRYGLDYESLRQLNPRLVYCSLTGYGQDGPDAHKPGYDFVFQAQGGLMSITGERDDLPGGGPQTATSAERASTSTSRCSTASWPWAPTRSRGIWPPARCRTATAMRTQASCPTRCFARPPRRSSWPWATTNSGGASAKRSSGPTCATTLAGRA
jgi:hypothetical protein